MVFTMSLPDDLRLSRHMTSFMSGDIPKEMIAVSSPEIMEIIEPIFEGYVFSASTSLVDLRTKIESLFFARDPLGIVEKGNLNQIDEYRAEADMAIWLFLLQKLSADSFWAIWEYQFSDSNPYTSGEDSDLIKLFNEVESLLQN